MSIISSVSSVSNNVNKIKTLYDLLTLEARRLKVPDANYIINKSDKQKPPKEYQQKLSQIKKNVSELQKIYNNRTVKLTKYHE